MNTDICCICLETKPLNLFFKNHETCRHKFCQECIKNTKKYCSKKCPICREKYRFSFSNMIKSLLDNNLFKTEMVTLFKIV